MRTRIVALDPFRLCLAGLLFGWLLAGCHAYDSSGDQWPSGGQPTPGGQPSSPSPSSLVTGTLTISVEDPEGRPLADASVLVQGPGMEWKSSKTGPTGLVTFDSVPKNVSVGAVHDFGISMAKSFTVAQDAVTFITLTVPPLRPMPTAALLPVAIRPGSLSADRKELSLQVVIVSSSASPFLPTTGQPFVGLTLDGVSATVSRTQHTYTLWGTSGRSVPPETPAAAMLLLDQSQRVSALDPSGRRSYAAREFIRRSVGATEPSAVAVIGLAGASATSPAAMLPELPVWSPLGTDTAFSTDGLALGSAVADLEPLIGGSAPIFEGLAAAFALTAAQTPPGNRTVVALLGGADDMAMSESSRMSALAELQQRQLESGIRVLLIVGAPLNQPADRQSLAELAAALQAPTIAMGISPIASPFDQSWASGTFGTLDLAADLIEGLPLPTLSAEFHIAAAESGAFPAGAILHGAVHVESEPCPFDCQYLPLEFAVEIP